MVDFSVPRQAHVQFSSIVFSLLSAEVDARVESRLPERMDIPPTWVDKEGQEGFPLREASVRRRPTRRFFLWPGDMPRSVQDTSESGSEDIQGVGHNGSVPKFDHVDTDDDTDSVIDALQRDLEGDEIPAETPEDSRGSTLVVPEPVHPHAADGWFWCRVLSSRGGREIGT